MNGIESTRIPTKGNLGDALLEETECDESITWCEIGKVNESFIENLFQGVTLFRKKKTAEEYGYGLTDDFFDALKLVFELAARDHVQVDKLSSHLQHEALAFVYFVFDVSIQAGIDKALGERILDGLIKGIFETFPNLPDNLKQLIIDRATEYAQLLQNAIQERNAEQFAFAVSRNVLPDFEERIDKVLLLHSLFKIIHETITNSVLKERKQLT